MVKKCELPESSVIGSVQAYLSMLLLKLIVNDRLSHRDRYDQEQGLSIFSAVNVLSKSVYMGTYSCRTSQDMLEDFQRELVSHFQGMYLYFYKQKFENSIEQYSDYN